MKNTFNLKEIVNKVRSVMKNLPNEVAITLEQEIDNNFKTESFFGKKWESRRRESRSDKKNKGNRNLLVESGELRREVTDTKVVGNEVKVETSLPYAVVHNNGEGNMKQRQFIGESPELDRKIKKKIEKELAKMFR